MDLRHKLNLLVLETEPPEVGLVRITQDQQRRTEVRLAAQRRLSKPKKERKPKAEKPPKVKREAKPRRKRKVA